MPWGSGPGGKIRDMQTGLALRAMPGAAASCKGIEKSGLQSNLHAIYGGVEFGSRLECGRCLWGLSGIRDASGLDRFQLAQRTALPGAALPSVMPGAPLPGQPPSTPRDPNLSAPGVSLDQLRSCLGPARPL